MRKAYIREQQARGRKAVAVLPVHYPKEVLTAAGVLAVELWGPPGPPRHPAAGRLQAYVCAVGRNALAFLAGGHADLVDAVLFPHTCDTIQGLATLLPDLGGWSKPALTFQHPKGDDRGSARRFLRAELERFAVEVGRLAGAPVAREALARAVALHAEIDALRATLLARRAALDLSDRALYDLLRRGEFLWPEDHLGELRAAAARLGPGPVQRGLPLLVTGYVPEPMALLDYLAEVGAFVAADDWAATGRRATAPPDPQPADPFDALVEKGFSGAPCTTRGASRARRLSHLDALLERSGALGVMAHVPKFCEPELFDLPALRRHFGERGVPVLVLETELEAELPAQARARLEAFAEMLSARRARA
jgi:benzoyl-CoA reductase/2-hydroxyglutaryl-CoA dehydratase subunit BcrC/BadD/HgdB